MASANRVSRSLDLEVKVIDSETRELGSALLWMPGLSSFLPFVCSYLTAHLGCLNVMKRVGVSSNQIKEGLWKEVWKPGREWESTLAALISQVPRLSKAKVLTRSASTPACVGTTMELLSWLAGIWVSIGPRYFIKKSN